jgi:hypothetical protein
MIVRRIPGKDRKALEVALKTLDSKVAKVGWFKGAKYSDGTQVAYIATIQEYGYSPKNIPPRPFMRPTVVKYKNTWHRIAELESKMIVQGKSTPYKMMEALGQNAAGNVRKTITQLYTPSLAFSTIQARLSRKGLGGKGRPYTRKEIGNLYKPLVDTGHMLATLISVVENK